MSSYARQCYELAVESHDHATANYRTYGIQARDDTNNAMVYIGLQSVAAACPALCILGQQSGHPADPLATNPGDATATLIAQPESKILKLSLVRVLRAHLYDYKCDDLTT